MNTIDWATAYDQYAYWRLNQSGKSPRTWDGESPGLRQFIALMADLGIDGPARVRMEHLNVWWDQQAHLANSTQATRLSQLRTFIHYCINRGWMKNDPTLLLRAKPVVTGQRLRLTARQLLDLIEVAPHPRDRILLALATNLGIRGGEITRLRIRDVDLANNEITVRIDKTNQVDVMPITSDLRPELERWLAFYRSNSDGLTADSYLVPSMYTGPTGWRLRHNRAYLEPYRSVRVALVNLGIDVEPGEGVHTVRRSVARLFFDFMEQSESFDSALLATMSLLHHSRADTTLTYIGRDRAVLGRDRVLRGQPFLRKLAAEQTPRLAVAQ